ncbi:glycosyltransferase family 2 protein [Aquimarina sp. TRL1]|uniref:glycosyltransferase family 2 protein n=1 Tax=Aquimarina sp. (strain TRL1) TaxID=2736252 RepID=UPI00158EAA79|nr:glycosyltransferase family 2 protein [Aquimarina sp. TRL1]QKX04717.1 glycosyltransferase family 2 protein [Aquimarina sp. TRL1]
MKVLVSVITPLYNSSDYIEQCIDSVKKQTYLDWEHILVDDCSKDDSFSKVENYIGNDNRFKLIQLEENSGAGVARNKGIEIASGRFIAFLDSDDTWSPNKLDKQLGFMLSNNYDFSFTSYKLINEEGKDLNKVIKCKGRVTYKKALLYNPIGCLTVIYDTNSLGKLFMPLIRKRQDYALWLNILKKTQGFGMNEVLASYRVREDSISSNKFNLIKYHWVLYRKIEKLSFLKSIFYLLSVIIHKLLKID